jgi:hypothetical protein
MTVLSAPASTPGGGRILTGFVKADDPHPLASVMRRLVMKSPLASYLL